jgi:hypothetical protein
MTNSTQARAAEIARGLTEAQREAVLYLYRQEDCFVVGASWKFSNTLKQMANRHNDERDIITMHYDHNKHARSRSVWNLTDFGRAVARALKDASNAD